MQTSQDYGEHTPDPSKPFKRYYKVARRNRRTLLNPTWQATTSNDYSDGITYFNWHVFDPDISTQQVPGEMTVTWYFKFRKPVMTAVDPTP